MHLKNSGIVTLLLLLLGQTLMADDEAYYKDFQTFLEVSGSNATQKVVLTNMFNQFKAAQPNNPAFAQMEDLMSRELEALNKKLFPIYKKYISHEDMKMMIQFFQSPAGKRMVEYQPKIVQESMQIGMSWGQDVARRVLSAQP